MLHMIKGFIVFVCLWFIGMSWVWFDNWKYLTTHPNSPLNRTKEIRSNVIIEPIIEIEIINNKADTIWIYKETP